MNGFEIIHRSVAAEAALATESLPPDLTVVMPINNVAPYLPSSFGSLTVQGDLRLEVIIIDYKSTDGSREMAIEFANRNPHMRVIVIDQIARGFGRARNFAVGIATGTYIAFLDGDDLFAPEILSQMVSFARAQDCELVMCKGAAFEHYTKVTHPYDNWVWAEALGNKRYIVTNAQREPRLLQLEQPNVNNRVVRLSFMKEHKILSPDDKRSIEDAPPHFKSLFAASRVGMLAICGHYCRVARLGNATTAKGSSWLDSLDVMDMILAESSSFQPDAQTGGTMFYTLLRLIHWCGMRTYLGNRHEFFSNLAVRFAKVPRAWVDVVEEKLHGDLFYQTVISTLKHKNIDLLVALGFKKPSGLRILFHFLRHGRWGYVWYKRKEITGRIFGT